MKRIFQKSLYHKLIAIMMFFLILPFMIVTAVLYQKVLSEGEQSYRSNIELVASQVQAQREKHLDNIREISDRIASNKELKGFLLADYNPQSLNYYSGYIKQIVMGSLNYQNIYLPKIYFQNQTIPRGFQIFYHLSDMAAIPVVSHFLKGEDETIWVTPEMAQGYPASAFTPFREHYTYMRKIYSDNKLLYLMTLSVPMAEMDHFLYENYESLPNINHEILRDENHILINCSTNPVTVDGKWDQQAISGRNSQTVEISFPGFPQTITYIWPANPQRIYLVYGIALFSVFGIGAILIVIRFVRKIFFSIFNCIDCFEQSVQSGIYGKLPVDGADELSRIKMAFNSLTDKLQALIRLTAEQSSLVKESQLKALQQQINPHFMYNTLEAFSYKMELYQHFEEADAITAFSNMLRYNIAPGGRYATLGEELEQVNSYIRIQRIKYTAITYDAVVPQQLYDMEIPRFCLQPFVENSFAHGYYGKPLHILLSCVDLGAQILFEICDNGQGIPQPQLDQLNRALLEDSPSEEHIGIGLKNINTRLKLYYSEQYRIHLESSAGKWTLITFRIPK